MDFGGSKAPKVPAPPPAPTLEDPATKLRADQAAAQAASLARSRRGRASTILTQTPSVRGVSLLGGGERQV